MITSCFLTIHVFIQEVCLAPVGYIFSSEFHSDYLLCPFAQVVTNNPPQTYFSFSKPADEYLFIHPLLINAQKHDNTHIEECASPGWWWFSLHHCSIIMPRAHDVNLNFYDKMYEKIQWIYSLATVWMLFVDKTRWLVFYVTDTGLF